MTREELLARARKHMWASWALSSEEMGSQAADTLLGLGMLVPEGGAAELEQLRGQVSELKASKARARAHTEHLATTLVARTEDLIAAESADVLPVPVGPEPLALTDQQVDALATAGNRVVNDEVHKAVCMCDAWPERCLSSGDYFMGAWDVSGLETAIPAVLGLWEQMRGGEAARLRARVSELEARIATALAPHVQYEDSAHCQADGEPWPCLVTAALTGPDRVQRSADKLTALFAPTQALREEPVPACKKCGAPESKWCPDCAACPADCYSHRSRSSCAHSRAPWGDA